MIEKWLLEYIPKGELAVDVGANEGDWILDLSNNFKKVIAIEPDERIFCKIPLLYNVELIKGVVGDVDGELEMFLRPHAGHNSLLSKHPIEPEFKVPVVDILKVKSFRLDTLFPEGADFVKIDTEGFEVNVLQGCEKNWERTLFIVECHDNYDGVYKELQRLGKSIKRINHPFAGTHPGHCWAIGR